MNICLIIDAEGQFIGDDSGNKLGEWASFQGFWASFQGFRYPNRIRISRINWGDAADPGYNDWTRDEVVRAQAAAHDAMVRDNLALSENIRKLQQKLTQTYEVLRGYNTNIEERPGHAGGVFDEACRVMRWLQQLEAENKGLRGDVKQAESHYEAACQAIDATMEILADTSAGSPSPVLDLARKVVADLRQAQAESRAAQALWQAVSEELEVVRTQLDGQRRENNRLRGYIDEARRLL